MTRFPSVLAGVIAVGLGVSVAQAQGVTSPDTAMRAPEVVAASEREAAVDHEAPRGPTIESAVVGPRAVHMDMDPASADALAQQGGFGRAETYMIVGGAAFVAGLLIGDDAGTVVMVGGALMGLYGLYLYLQNP
jgi:hypothetical protein